MRISHKYLIESIVFISYVLFAMAWVGGTASMNEIMASMDINSLASASMISGAITLAKILGTFVAAFVVIKFGLKTAFFISAILVSFGILTPVSENYELLLLSRFIMGLGGALMIVYFNPIVLHCFTAEERPIINGLNAVAFNIGTAIILWFMPHINQISGNWQISLAVFSITSLLLALIWLLVKLESAHKSENISAQTHSVNYSYSEGLKDKFNWIYALSYSGLLAFYICLFTFYPQAGISNSKWVIGFGIIGTLVGIIFSKQVSLRIPVIRWSGLAIVFSIIGLTYGGNNSIQLLSSITLGFFIFLPMTALITLPQELPNMTTQRITVVFSLFWSISYLLATVVLWVFGRLVDMNDGNYGPSFMFITIVSSSIFIGSFFLPETGKAYQQLNPEVS